MIEIVDKSKCCGCSACEQVCPKNAISMKRDSIGFCYPFVEKNECIECNLCEKICPIINENESRLPNRVYALKNKNLNERLNSSSGGVFLCLARETISQGGVVYGAAFDEDWSVKHVRIDSMEEISRLQGSKYVQSRTHDIYRLVKKDLLSRKKVLFSGCPCQIAGLKHFLQKEYDNLITVDVVCHGVPNPRIWEDFIKEEKKIEQNPIEKISFRDKSTGWNKFSFVMTFKKLSTGESYTKGAMVWSHTYMQLFLYDFIARPSCHSCCFRKGKSGSDMTMCDFWAVEKAFPSFADNDGISALMFYKGELSAYMKQSCDCIEATYENVCNGNPALVRDWPENKESKLFYFFYDRIGCDLRKSLKIAMIFFNCRKIICDIIRKTKKSQKKYYFMKNGKDRNYYI